MLFAQKDNCKITSAGDSFLVLLNREGKGPFASLLGNLTCITTILMFDFLCRATVVSLEDFELRLNQVTVFVHLYGSYFNFVNYINLI